MALNITSAATNIGLAKGIQITVNTGFTGTVIITTAGSTQYNTQPQTIGTITNPVEGQNFRYGGLHGQGAITITPSTTCDLSVTKLSRGL